MFSPIRFLDFARRFAPLWLVWLVVALIPVSREVWQLHTLGSPLVSLYDQPWRQSFGRGREFNGFRVAKKNPRDLDAQLWRFSLMTQGLTENYDNLETTDFVDISPIEAPKASAVLAKKSLREAQAIQKAFPREKWLRALAVRSISKDMEAWLDVEIIAKQRVLPPAMPPPADEPLRNLSNKRANQLARVVQNAAKSEPDNAYYALVEAEIWRRNRNLNSMWRALNRAAKCKVFETHDLEFARAIVNAHQAIRPLILEEKNEIWRANNDSSNRSFEEWTNFLGREGRAAQKRGEHRRVIEIAAILASVGDLMQRSTNTRAVALTGDNWKKAAWVLTPRPKFGRGNARAYQIWKNNRTRHFANYAALHGRKDVALQVPKWATRQRELFYLQQELLESYSYSGSETTLNPSKRDALARAAKWRDAGAVVLLHGLFVSLLWFLSNLFLWRAVGAPSAKSARILPALLMAMLSLCLALWTWHYAEILDAVPWNAQKGVQTVAVASVGILAFFGAPFLLAIACAAATMFGNRLHFLWKSRIETELRLGTRDAFLLKSGATMLCVLSLFLTLFFYLWWLMLVAFDVRTIDLFAWLPNDAKGRSWSWAQPSEMLFAPLMYCLFLSFVGFLLWFAKWRYFGGKDNRALTHGGLRRWKEALGVYLILMSALYLVVALSAWPARIEASRELENRMARGELVR